MNAVKGGVILVLMAASARCIVIERKLAAGLGADRLMRIACVCRMTLDTCISQPAVGGNAICYAVNR